ncbi:IclR family transcriptional regulator [Pseudomonas sp.]|uniref:IclR family transcriptional regulator n=1 Tax=Pseudomonas sp. TaxID=306 RepID=UPI002899E4B8|nr:IclR family transcriptional regulator [Pseudomonas sp.]
MANESKAPESSRRQKVQSAEVGTDILKGLADLAPATSLSKLAEHLEMPASKVHRYLQALIASGFAEQDETTNHYGLGPAALYVGMVALGRLDVVKVSVPKLATLRDAVNETCFLAVWGNHGPAVVHVEQAVRAVTLVTQVGSVLPLLSSSTGLVFNAFLPDSETAPLRKQALRQAGAPTQKVLADTMASIRAHRLHSIHGLFMEGVNALSAPVFAAGSRLVGVLTIVGAAQSFSAEPGSLAAQRLLETAEAISQRMGGSFA